MSSQARSLIMILLVIMVDTAKAETWRVVPTFNETLGYDDNILLTEQNPVGSFSALAVPKLELGLKEENFSAALTSEVDDWRYLNHTFLNHDDYHVGLTSAAQSQATKLTVNADYNNRSTQVSEFESGGSGVFLPGFRQEQWLLHPTIEQQVTTAVDFTGALNYTNIQYSGGGYQNYDDLKLNPGLNYRLNAIEQVKSDFFYNRFHADPAAGLLGLGSSADADRYAATVGYERSLDKEWMIAIAVGGEAADLRNEGVYLDAIATVKLSYSTENWRAGLTYQRSDQPSSLGALRLTDYVALTFTGRLDPRILGTLTASWGNDSKLGRAALADRAYYDLEPALLYQITESVAIGPEYQLRQEKFAGAANQRLSNTALITMKWQPSGWPLDL